MKSLTKRDLVIDWKKFGSIDINRFSEQISNNTSLVNEFGAYIAFCSTDGEFDTKAMDQNFVKLFKISQIIIEYLLNEFNRLKSSENEMKSQNNLIQENKKLRKLLEIHQKAMTYNGTDDGDHIQCPHCPKSFYNSTFLKTHIARRHPKESLDSEGMFSLTRKIEKYQSVLIGDNKTIDQMRTEIQALSEKLGKTELDLLLEKEARMKLEERIEYDVELRVQEIHEKLREELEEFKFTQSEKLFERESRLSPENVNKTTDYDNEEQTLKSAEVNKIEEIIAIQAKEMIKLGNNVQKLVSHLTDSLPLNTREKQKQESNSISTNVKKTAPTPEPQTYTKNVTENKNKFETKSNTKETKKIDELPNKYAKSDLKDTKKEIPKSVYGTKKSTETESFSDETETSLKEKLTSLGIDFNAKGITEEEFTSAMKKVKAERKLSIEQNRHDFDYVSVEKHIRQLVEEKVSETSNKKAEKPNLVKSNESEVKERKTVAPRAKDEPLKTQTSKPYETQSIEAIVHMSPIIDSSVTSDRNTIKAIGTETKQELNASSSQVPQTQAVRPKSALARSSLKSGINNGHGDNENGVKAKQQKRIRFSEHLIERQISPEESHEDTSDDYSSMDSNNESLSAFSSNNVTLIPPIPAQRNKTAFNSQIRDQVTDDFAEDVSYEVDDDLMDEILHSKPYSMNSDLTESDTNRGIGRNAKNPNQTRVQELTEMIEQQLSKRSAINKKPPVGSVNVMSTNKRESTSKSLLGGLSDSEDEYS